LGGRCRVECHVVMFANPQHKKKFLAGETLNPMHGSGRGHVVV
jgi:hypothetical protein